MIAVYYQKNINGQDFSAIYIYTSLEIILINLMKIVGRRQYLTWYYEREVARP